MRDEITGLQPRVNECAIVNLDSSDGPGTHWVAFSKCGSRALYYDSFGDLPPPREIASHLAGSSISFNYTSEQSFDTVVCGHLCLLFLIKASRHWHESSK